MPLAGSVDQGSDLEQSNAGDQHRPLHPIPCPASPAGPARPAAVQQAGHLFNEARMADYDPAPTSDEEIEQAYQEKYG